MAENTDIYELGELWEDIREYLDDLSRESYIDDQVEIDLIWELVEEYKENNDAENEPWSLKETILNDIFKKYENEYSALPDPLDDLIDIICLTEKEKSKCTEIMHEAGYR